jgi:hypothetical protein
MTEYFIDVVDWLLRFAIGIGVALAYFAFMTMLFEKAEDTGSLLKRAAKWVIK